MGDIGTPQHDPFDRRSQHRTAVKNRAITARLFESEPAVRRYETSFVKRVHKQSAAVVLD